MPFYNYKDEMVEIINININILLNLIKRRFEFKSID